MRLKLDHAGIRCRTPNCLSALLIAIATACNVGCNATLSVYPLYDANSVANEPRVVGEWRGELRNREHISFRAKVVASDAKVYRVTLKDESQAGNKRLGLPADYDLQVVKIGGHVYLDVTPRRVLDLNAPEQYNPLLVPGHLILMCSFDETSISLRAISAHRIRQVANRDGLDVPILVQGDANPVLTLPTERLHGLILKYADALFEEKSLVLQRVKAEEAGHKRRELKEQEKGHD